MVTVAVKGGLFDNESTTDYALLSNHAPCLTGITPIINKGGVAVDKAVINKLLANAIGAGGNVTVTRKRIKGYNEVAFEGNNEVETVTLINRATTSADNTKYQAITKARTITYPTNKAGIALGAAI